MTFLCKKSQVLDVELTQHGKRQLARGKFQPTFYSFHDDDILYDTEYANMSENRNDASERIRNETPSLVAQYLFDGIETTLKRSVEEIRNSETQEAQLVIPGVDKHYSQPTPLGASSLNESNAPAWNVNILSGIITGSVVYSTGSTQPNIKIPQINLGDVTYKTSVAKVDMTDPLEGDPSGDFGDDSGTVSDLNYISSRFEDNTYIKIEEDYILIEISEDNVDSLQENFDIEVFYEETDAKTSQKIFTPLSFDVRPSLIENEILVDQETVTIPENKVLDPTYVDHFFHVYVDDEISKRVLCSHAPSITYESGFPNKFLDCEELPDAQRTADGLYDSDVTEIDDDC